MKKIIFTLLLTISITRIHAQAFEISKSYISAGYGVGSFGQSLIKAALYGDGNDYTYKLMGPVFFKYEYGITEKIGIGANIAYVNGSVSSQYIDYDFNTGNDVLYTEKLEYKSWSALARINFHIGDNDKVDPYFGVGLGYKAFKAEYTSTDPSSTSDGAVNSIPLGMDATFGCRFLFTDNIGAYAEVGMAKAVLQFGLCGKF